MAGIPARKPSVLTRGKRVFDICLALALLPLVAVMLGGLVPWLLLRQGRPIFHMSERMKSVDKAFFLWKLRTMRLDTVDSGVTGGDKTDRVTPTGAWLRALRLDEVPQIWNILRGDMSFVGPRPPLRNYVAQHPQLYARVLRSRPGLTGLATVLYHKREESLLASCGTAAETDAVYRARCIPQKARLDLLYQKRSSILFDCRLLAETVQSVLPGKSRQSVTFQSPHSTIVSGKRTEISKSETNWWRVRQL